MHRELGPFANQIGYHNTKSIRSIELTVFHKDDNPVPKISALDKAYYKQVESVKVILAKRHKIHKVDLGIDQKTEWVKFRIGMMNMMRKMGKTMVKQQQQGAGWKVADCREKTLVYSKGDYGLMSKVWLLDRLRTAPKVYKKKNVADSEDPLLASEEVAGQGGVDVSEGSVDSEATKVGGLSMDMEDTAIRTGLPTSDTMPEPDSNATAKMGIGKDCWRLQIGRAHV